MPKFIYVPDKLRIGCGQYINVADIHRITIRSTSSFEVEFSLAGRPNQYETVDVSREELANVYSLDQIK